MTRWVGVLILAGVGVAVPLAGQAPVGNVEEVLSLGALDGPLELTFSRVVGVEVASTGEILIADRAENSIRVFSPSGDFVGVFGREGSGPAEFRSLAATAMLGDTLYVLDWRLQKIALFTLDGLLVRTRRIDYSPGQHGLIYRMYPLRNGGFLLESGSGCYMPRRPGFDTQWWLHFLPPNEETLVQVLREDIGRSVAVYGTEEDRFCTSFIFPFGTGPIAAATPDGVLAYGTGEHEVVFLFEPSFENGDSVVIGDPVASRHVHDGRRRIGREARQKWLEQQVAPLSGNPTRSRRASRVREVLDEVALPERWPAFDRLRFDPEGGLWIRTPPELEDENAIWDVYSPDGDHRGRVTLPVALQVRHFGRDAVFGVIRDEWGVQYVKEYAIHWAH